MNNNTTHSFEGAGLKYLLEINSPGFSMEQDDFVMTTTVDWDDGSGDKIYISADAFGGNQNVLVSSDANAGSERSKDITFEAGGITRVLNVKQAAGIVVNTFTANPNSYIPKTTDGSWYSITNPSNAYDDENNSTYCQFALTRGDGAETWIYWLFDLSSIPANATILSVECNAKVYSGTTNAADVEIRQAQLFCGSNPKGSSKLIPQPAAIQTIDGGNWTRAELNDLRLRMYGKRGSANVNTTRSFRLYGATLTIRYTV